MPRFGANFVRANHRSIISWWAFRTSFLTTNSRVLLAREDVKFPERVGLGKM